MQYGDLLQKLQEVGPPEKAFWDDFCEIVMELECPNGHIWLAQGNMAKKIAFISEGSAMAYFADDREGKRLTRMGAGHFHHSHRQSASLHAQPLYH